MLCSSLASFVRYSSFAILSRTQYLLSPTIVNASCSLAYDFDAWASNSFGNGIFVKFGIISLLVILEYVFVSFFIFSISAIVVSSILEKSYASPVIGLIIGASCVFATLSKYPNPKKDLNFDPLISQTPVFQEFYTLFF